MSFLRRVLANILVAVAVVTLTIIMTLVLWLLPEHDADELKKEIL